MISKFVQLKMSFIEVFFITKNYISTYYVEKVVHLFIEQ